MTDTSPTVGYDASPPRAPAFTVLAAAFNLIGPDHMQDLAEDDPWDAVVNALAASQPVPVALRRGAASTEERAAMAAATQEITAALYVVAELLADEQYGGIDEAGIYADPVRELKMIAEAKIWLDRALDKMQSTDWCLEPVSKPRGCEA